MRINEVEARVGITKKNIRFYESEGLLTPGREGGNGYRSYSEADVRRLGQIKALRMLDMPLAEIKAMLEGTLSLPDAVRRHRVTLEARQKSMEGALELCDRLQNTPNLEALDPEELNSALTAQQEKGVQFVDVRKQDRKKRYLGAVFGAVVFCALMALVGGSLTWAYLFEADPPPLWLFGTLMLLVIVSVVCVFVALYQRFKEIKGGEADAYRNY